MESTRPNARRSVQLLGNQTRRGLLGLGGAAAASLAFARPSFAQPAAAVVPEIRIATVLPSRTGLIGVATSATDFAGEGGRNGALLAEAVLGQVAAPFGTLVDISPANSPTADAAVRAGERLVATTDICAIIGGVGDGQAEVLSRIAGDAGIPFFNIGSAKNALRNAACNRFTFHIEPSESMFIDALVMYGVTQNYRRWFIVHLDTEEGFALLARATRALAQLAPDAEIVGSAAPNPEQPIYLNELQAARRAEPDVILLLLNSTDSIVFTGQQADVRVEVPVLELPDAISQTRDYIAATRNLSPEHNPRVRVATWETTLPAEDAAAFNQRYGARWSEPTDPTGWAAFHAVKILVETVLAIGSKDGEAIVEYLERPETTFDILKGPGSSFRPWDHQLRQPVYLVSVDQEAEWSRTVLANRIGIVSFMEELPATEPGTDRVAWLDQLGDGPDETTCSF